MLTLRHKHQITNYLFNPGNIFIVETSMFIIRQGVPNQADCAELTTVSDTFHVTIIYQRKPKITKVF